MAVWYRCIVPLKHTDQTTYLPRAYANMPLLQILKHTASSSTCSASASPDTGAQLFPFGEEYTISSAPGSKVPPLRKAAQEAKTGYDQKVDVWAVGCLLFELLTGMSRRLATLLGIAC